MEEKTYKVSQAIMAELFDFEAKRFHKGRENRRSWDKFFENSAGPKKWRKETKYSGVSAKIRVQHATKGKKSQCPAASTLTIALDKLIETAEEFVFEVTLVSSGCTCLCKYMLVARLM